MGTVQDKCLSDQLRSYVFLLREDSSRKTIPASKIRSEGSRWTVGVQRLLQPTRELVKSGYKTGLRVKVLLLPGD